MLRVCTIKPTNLTKRNQKYRKPVTPLTSGFSIVNQTNQDLSGLRHQKARKPVTPFKKSCFGLR